MRLHDPLCGFRTLLGFRTLHGFRTIAEIFASLWTFSVEEKAYPGGLPARFCSLWFRYWLCRLNYYRLRFDLKFLIRVSRRWLWCRIRINLEHWTFGNRVFLKEFVHLRMRFWRERLITGDWIRITISTIRFFKGSDD